MVTSWILHLWRKTIRSKSSSLSCLERCVTESRHVSARIRGQILIISSQMGIDSSFNERIKAIQTSLAYKHVAITILWRPYMAPNPQNKGSWFLLAPAFVLTEPKLRIYHNKFRWIWCDLKCLKSKSAFMKFLWEKSKTFVFSVGKSPFFCLSL